MHTVKNWHVSTFSKIGTALILCLLIGGVMIGRKQWKATVPIFQYTQKQTISPLQEMRLSFPHEMNERSVEKNLAIPDAMKIQKKWMNGKLVLQPVEPLKIGTTYTITVTKDSERRSGETLGRDIVYIFDVTKKPAIVTRIPSENAENIAVKSKIVVVFDRPMVALAALQTESAKNETDQWNATITPHMEGKWHWLSTTTVEFQHDTPFHPSTRYTVSVQQGDKQTDEKSTWSFTTIRPVVIDTSPAQNTTQAGPSSPLKITFNQPMDLESMEKNIELYTTEAKVASAPNENENNLEREDRLMDDIVLNTPVPSALPVPKNAKRLDITSVRYGTVDVQGRKKLEKNSIEIIPKGKLSLERQYFLKVKAGVKGSNGEQGMKEEFRLAFSTIGSLKAEVTLQYGNIMLKFTNPMPLHEDMKKYITITPEPDGWKEFRALEFETYERNSLYFSPTLKPRTTYKFTLKDAVDEYGQKMEKPYSTELKTPPLDPSVHIESRGSGEFGFFEREKAPIYYIHALNVKKLDVEMAKLSLEEFLTIQKEKEVNSRYAPVLKGKKEYQTWSLPTKLQDDTWEVQAFDIRKKIGHALDSGIYALTVSAPEYKYMWGMPENIKEQQYFALTNIALTLKYSGNRTLVWAVDMRTGEPINDATITYFSLNGNKILSGKTDRRGLFEAHMNIKDFVTHAQTYIPQFWVTAEKNGDFSFVGSDWSNGIRPYDFDNVTEEFFGVHRATDKRPMGYIYSDKSVYRAGDTVQYKGIWRELDDNGNMLPPKKDTPIEMSIMDPDGKMLDRNTMKLSSFGTWHGAFQISQNAPVLGQYTLLARSDNTTVTQNFSVLAYRKPEFNVDVVTERDDYFNHDTISASVKGNYYFGAPMSGAPVEWRATMTDYYFNKFTDGYYSFALENEWCWYDCERQTEEWTSGKGSLNEKGELTIKIPTNIDAKNISQIASIEATVNDPNNQEVSRAIAVPIHQSQVYVGIRTTEYVVNRGEEAGVDIVTLHPDGTPMPKQSVTLKLLSRTWNTVKKKGVDGEYYYDNQPKDTFIHSQTVQTDERGKAQAHILLEKGGEYRIIASGKDAKGRESKAATSIYAWSNVYFNWPHQNNDRIDILADKPEYKVGDIAKLLIKSPYQGSGVKALVTVERENILQTRIVNIQSNAQAIDVPITEDLIPNVYVSVVLIKARNGETFSDEGRDTGSPAYRVGYINLSVNAREKRMNMTILTDKEKYSPGESVTATIRTTDWKGKPLKAEFSLAAVDMSVIALTGFHMPDLVRHFYEQRGLGILTANMMTYLVERIKPGSKGGGGSDPKDAKRLNLKDTAYWNAELQTDESGKATVQFPLPDNLTTWQLLAIGNTANNLFGAAAKTIVETKKVLIRPVHPRFAVSGDTMLLGAIVHNLLPTREKFTISLKGNGFVMNGKQSSAVSIEPNTMAKIQFPVTMGSDSQATINFTAEARGIKDEIEEKIPLYKYGSPQSVATSGQTTSGATEHVFIPSKQEAGDGVLSVTASPHLMSLLPSGRKYIEEFPYESAEKIISKTIIDIALKKVQTYKNNAITAADKISDESLRGEVTTTLQKVYMLQKGDGGFGYWNDSTESYPYLTAYILEGLHTIQSAGYPVDEKIVTRAKNYLRSNLRTEAAKGNDPLSLATRAYILFVLTEVGESDESSLNNLYEKRELLPLFARAYLAMALKNLDKKTTSAKAVTLLTEMLDKAKVNSRGVHFDEETTHNATLLMSTNNRTSALITLATRRIDPSNSLLPSMIKNLLIVRSNGHWDTTQSTAISILTLLECLQNDKDTLTPEKITININGKKEAELSLPSKKGDAAMEIRRNLGEFQQKNNIAISLQKTGKSTLYYDVLMSYFSTADDLQPIESGGMSIARSIEPIAKEKNEMTVGGTYKVILTMTVSEDRHFVGVESPLPAGMEAIDFSLMTTKKSLQANLLPFNNASGGWEENYFRNGLWRFAHKEFRDDRVFLFADYLPSGVYQYEYLVRATMPGRFHYRPARIWEIYAPENFGQTSGGWMNISDSKSS